MNDLKLIPIPEDIKQDKFPDYIEKKGWICLRLIKKNYKKIDNIINKIKKDSWNACTIRDMESLGKPDFFIYKGERFYFCEFKSKKDMLRNEQFSWMANHINYPKALAFVCLQKRKINRLSFDEETVKQAIEQFIERNTTNVLDEYQKKNPWIDYETEYKFFREVVENKLKEIIKTGGFVFDVPSRDFVWDYKKYLYFYYK